MGEVYLDNSATTWVEPDTAAVAMELMASDYGNPSSLHRKGLEAQLRMDKARAQVAAALDCPPESVHFTSGGTEANNLALFGAAEARKRRGKTIVSTLVEHASVLKPLRRLEELGFTVRLVPPDPSGAADPGALADAVDGDTILLSCMLVNSEVGAVNQVDRAARLARKKAPHLLVHCDAVQALGKIPLSLRKLDVDLLSVSGHKIHAPKGVGALFVKRGVRIVPILYGGGQERGLRAGTENSPLACAFGYAAEKAVRDREKNHRHVSQICEYFVNKSATIPGLCINSPSGGTPYICSLSLPGFRSEILLHHLAAGGVYVSSGSACSRGERSHVLTAMGLPPERVDSALRVSFSRHSTKEDVDRFCQVLREGLDTLARSGGGA